MLFVAQIGMQSVSLKWSPPTEIAEGSEISQFYIDYTALNDNATEPLAGSTKRLVVPNTDMVEITNLEPGSLYAFSSKVVSYFIKIFINQKILFAAYNNVK